MKIDTRYKWGGPSKASANLVSKTFWDNWWVSWPATILLVGLSFWLALMPLSAEEQFVFGTVVLVFVFLLRPYAGSFITLVMIFLSILMSSRYLYWRGTETLNVTTLLDATFSIGLFISEGYAWMVLLLGYFQSIWPLGRKPTPMPADTSNWPSVDVLIPTYNEPLSVVKSTVMAASLLDWPTDKLKVYILDDGKRDDFREFAKELGVGYITRDDNRHAKAGNLNNALRQVSGEYVAIFDCDHITTRSFLQVTMGEFMKDPNLAVVQTPHHFLTPDPFERNLNVFRKVPNEGALFYGLVQDGNDLWNAAFFCGSCAVLKRAPLDEIGGIATDTVTEDAHTSLRLHRKGYNSAYLNVIQSGGLATETLASHIKQRMRWARGMVQMFRIDCPLFGKGLTLAQRFCYTNAIMHFMYGFPRMFFLLSPLVYLFFGSYIINATAGTIAVYALPHLILAFVANSRMQGSYRHSFWNETYETALGWYIMWPALFALINPAQGVFNVTAKGGYIEKDRFDWGIATPYVIFFLLNFAGMIIGILRMFWLNTYEWDTALINVIWTIYNLIMLTATIAVAWETRQVRRNWRVDRELPAAVLLSSGQEIDCRTRDYSEGGAAAFVPESLAVSVGDSVTLGLYRGDVKFSFPALVVGKDKVRNGDGAVLRLRFVNLSLQQQRELVAATLSRADAWFDWLRRKDVDHPLYGLKELISNSWLGVTRLRTAARKGA